MSTCKKFLTRHKPLTHRQWLKRMELSSAIDLEIDFFNSGPTIEMLERKLATLLGKEKALFVNKGMVGQHCALLHWSKLSESNKIAIHPQSHIAVDENDAYKELLGLDEVLFGKTDFSFSAADIDKLPSDLAAICIELPIRRAGFKLPSWQDLELLAHFANVQQIPLHIDGARLFEAACFWDKPYEKVASLGDSVYVSLYKTLGAAGGGVIAGDSDFIDDLKQWRSRMGGDLFTAFPYVLTALWGLDNYLPRIPEFHQRAITLSNVIANRLGSQAIPNPVQCNGFLVELAVSSNTLEQRALALAEKEKIWLFDRIFDLGPERCRFEIQVGDALDDWRDDELVEVLEKLIEG